MNHRILTPRPRFRPRVSLLVFSALLVAPAWAQVAATSAIDAAILTKYDVNRNGILDESERATLDADQKRAAGAVETGPSATQQIRSSDDVVALSPFEVVSDTKGYYAANTMSGTRFNTKLEDLGASISVMTKEQMQDFAMLDINDIFLYMAGAEGTGTYTDMEVNRNGDVQENVSMNPQGANRVRGIASANISLGNFETMGRTPVDPLGVDAVELSRGPNATVSGLGNPSGTVNMVPSSANLTRDRTQFQIRGDTYGGYRASLDLNRVIKPGVLSVRASGSFQHTGFELKPSGTNEIRYNAMVKYQPFKNTTITGSYSVYRMNGNRPNASPLRDNISYWLANGKPTWDPVAQVIHVGGQTLGPFTSDAQVPDYFNRSYTGSGRTQVYVGDNGIEFMQRPQSTQTANPGTGSGTIRIMSLSAGGGVQFGRFTAQPLFTTTPVVNDRNIYDYSSINLTTVNKVRDSNITGSVQLDQVFFNTPLHNLALQVGFMREDSSRYTRNILGELNQNGQSSQLMVDINERLIDGRPNPFFLRPYIGIDNPYTITQPQRWDTTRGQLAYRIDLTRQKSVLRWLGAHQLSGYQEFKHRVSRRYSYQDRVLSRPRIVNGVNTGGNEPIPYYHYYLGDNVGNNVDHGPTEMQNGVYEYIYGNPTTGYVNEPTELALQAVTGRAGGGSNSLRIMKTVGGVMQSFFFDHRIVTTFGTRNDTQHLKNGATPVQVLPDGTDFDYSGNINHWTFGDYRASEGKTTQKGVVVRPLRNWNWVTELAQSGGLTGALGTFMNGLALHYNESSSFRPEEPRFNLFEKELPNPFGTGKDYGFALSMFENKFVLKVNKYENAEVAARGSDTGTIAQRVTRIDFSQNDAFQLRRRAIEWTTALNPDWTEEQIQEDVGRQMGISWEHQERVRTLFTTGRLSSTNDKVSKGVEIELNFNPTNYWTLAASGTKTEATNVNVSREINDWIALRMPHWTTIRDLSDGQLWWTKNYGGSQTAAQNFASFVDGPYKVFQQAEGTSNPQIRKYAFRASTNLRLSGLTQHRILKNMNIGGALRWQDKGAIGYYGKQQLPATITELDRFNPIYDKAQYFIDAFVSYRLRLFNGKVNTSIQLNGRNLTESGNRLQPIGAYPDGTPHSYRIISPRQFILQATFDL